MKKQILCSLGFLIFGFTQLTAQTNTTFQPEEYNIMGSSSEKIVVDFDVTKISKTIAENKIFTSKNRKKNFHASLSNGNTLLTVTFTDAFSRKAIKELLELSGIEPQETLIHELFDLTNQ